MKKYEETFMENRESDWLASEIKREKRTSVWGFDDSRKSESQRHEEDCEKEEVAKQHATVHERYARANNLPYNQVHARSQSTSTVRTSSTGRSTTSAKVPGLVIAIFTITFMIIAFVFIMIFSSISGFGILRYGAIETVFSLLFNVVFIFIFISVISAIVKSIRTNSRK